MGTLSRRLLAGTPAAFVRLFSSKPGAAAALRRKDSLFYRLFDLGGATGKVASTIHEYVSNGRRLSETELEKCFRDLRKLKRFHLALELMEWMELRKFNLQQIHFSVRLDLIEKVKGMAAAKNYLNGLSPSAVTFNHLMSMHIKSGQPDKVLVLRIEMKKRKIRPDAVTYSIWMNTYARLNDIKGAECVFEEMKRENVKFCNWTSYSNLVNIYIKAGYQEKAKLALQNAEKEMGPHDLKAYHLLITLYASLSDLDEVHRIWSSLKSRISVVEKPSYLIMVQALANLGDIEGMTKCYKEWESAFSSYDVRFANAVISAYLRYDMFEEAVSVRGVAISISKQPLFYAWEQFMIFYLNKNQIKQALQTMETATSKASAKSKWKPRSDTVDKFLNFFKQESDVDGAEEFYKMMKRINCVDGRVYEALLETYRAAGKTMLDMRTRIERDGVEVSCEMEHLLASVCHA